jgi:DNA-binding MarR family transcriptional regulator
MLGWLSTDRAENEGPIGQVHSMHTLLDYLTMPADRMSRALWTLTRLHRQLEAADSGLTLPQFRMLSRLSAGGVQSAKLAEHLAVRKPTITAVADGLVAAGFAARANQEGDRRVKRLELTDAGRAALAAAEQAFADRLAPILAELDDPDRLLNDLAAVGEILDARMARKQPADVGDVAPVRSTPRCARPETVL